MLPIAASVLVAAVVAVVAVVAGSRTHPDTVAKPASAASSRPGAVTIAPLRCPTTQTLGAATSGLSFWVPEQPRGVDAADRMAPAETPTSAVVCGSTLSATGRTSGSRLLGGDLAGLAADLAWVPKDNGATWPCTMDLRRTDSEYYLIGLTYPSGIVWVSAPGNHCAGSSNGVFTSTVNLRAAAATAYATGRWAPIAALGSCLTMYVRLGQDQAMVPGDPISVYGCRNGVGPVDLTSHLAELAQALNSRPTTLSTHGCSPIPPATTMAAVYLLTFSYAVGPPATVEVTLGCRPEISTESLQASADTDTLNRISVLLPRG